MVWKQNTISIRRCWRQTIHSILPTIRKQSTLMFVQCVENNKKKKKISLSNTHTDEFIGAGWPTVWIISALLFSMRFWHLYVNLSVTTNSVVLSNSIFHSFMTCIQMRYIRIVSLCLMCFLVAGESAAFNAAPFIMRFTIYHFWTIQIVSYTV